MRNAESEAVLGKRHARIGEFLDALGQGVGVRDLQEGRLISVRIRLPTEEEPSTLLVIRATAQRGGCVAFVGGFSVGDVVLAWRARMAGSGMKWREDKPWKPKGEGV